MRIKRTIGGFFVALFLVVSIGQVVSATAGTPEWSEQVVAETSSDAGSNTSAQEAEEAISLYAMAAVLMDADTGRVLYGKSENDVLAMASTTKIMTCITVLEHVEDLDEIVSVSSYAASMPKVKLYIKQGEEYPVRELLFSLMLESHNDSAVALAEHVGKRYVEELKKKEVSEFTKEESKQAVAAFADLMNEKARELGCMETYFITPNGLDATETITLENGEIITKEHGTTAAELAKIMSYCIKESPKRDLFLEITRTPSYAFSENGRSFSCNNHNAFLNMMDGALSGKTGFTNKAGYCYVGALERDGRTFVVALLGCGWPNNKSYKWSDTKELMQFGIENFFYRSFDEENVAFDEAKLMPIPVREGQSEVLGEEVYTGVKVVVNEGTKSMTEGRMDGQTDAEVKNVNGLLLRADETIEVIFEQTDVLAAPVEADTPVGNICYTVNGVVYRTDSIVTTDTIIKIDFHWCMKEIWERFLLEL
ncbi:MAG: D-alanyl-D-alanine carboxypeptidase [Lachnospiraceae bacterium]|nr:D-alanyl-D-alanine carboxypeptidase [Lachnospiraceae bacterium]